MKSEARIIELPADGPNLQSVDHASCQKRHSNALTHEQRGGKARAPSLRISLGCIGVIVLAGCSQTATEPCTPGSCNAWAFCNTTTGKCEVRQDGGAADQNLDQEAPPDLMPPDTAASDVVEALPDQAVDTLLDSSQLLDQSLIPDLPLSSDISEITDLPLSDVEPTCFDQQKNAEETGVDCGGSTCPSCAPGQGCLQASDCTSLVCDAASLTCSPPSCEDGVLNGTESATDCGGSCPGCADGEPCNQNEDCASKHCDDQTNLCLPPDCFDGINNGLETDVDCGGAECLPCSVGQICQTHSDCSPNLCKNGICAYPASCADLQTLFPSSTSGTYTVRPSSAPQGVAVYCDMKTDGGGWTLFMQCLPTDGCTANSVVLYSADWLANDFGSTNTTSSFLLGQSLSSLTTKGLFMLQVEDTALKRVGSVLYPLIPGTTRKFFSAANNYLSTSHDATIIDYDLGVVEASIKVCWAPMTSPFPRSYQGQGGVEFLGHVSGYPLNSPVSPATPCNFGPWDAQMLLNNPNVGNTNMTASWGLIPVTDWIHQPYAHRIFLREKEPQVITIVKSGAGRQWSDGTYSRSCYDYLHPPKTGARVYQGVVGSGMYTLKPSEAHPPIDIYCDMETDGGGWTLIQRTEWDWNSSQALYTNFYTFFSVTVGNTSSAWRASGDQWLHWNKKKEFLAIYHARRAIDNASCAPLYYKGEKGTLSADAKNKIFRLSGLTSSVPLVSSEYLSTTDSGPRSPCVVNEQGVPWFYGASCQTFLDTCCCNCPTYKGTYWSEPHPMASFITSVPDMFGQTTQQTCGGAAPFESQGFYGLNLVETYMR